MYPCILQIYYSLRPVTLLHCVNTDGHASVVCTILLNFTSLIFLSHHDLVSQHVYIFTLTIRDTHLSKHQPKKKQKKTHSCFMILFFLLLFFFLCQIWVRFESRCGLSETLSSIPSQYIHVYYFLEVWPPACIQKCLQVE